MQTLTSDAVDMNEDIKTSAESQASICSVFANARRVMILWALVEQEKSVGEIATIIDASLQNTSQHLRLMKEMGILDSRRDGQTIYYYILENKLTERCQHLLQVNQQGK